MHVGVHIGVPPVLGNYHSSPDWHDRLLKEIKRVVAVVASPTDSLSLLSFLSQPLPAAILICAQITIVATPENKRSTCGKEKKEYNLGVWELDFRYGFDGGFGR